MTPGICCGAPELTFHAREIGRDALGYNVPNAVLLDALLARADDLTDLVFCNSAAVENIEPHHHSMALYTTDDHILYARLVCRC